MKKKYNSLNHQEIFQVSVTRSSAFCRRSRCTSPRCSHPFSLCVLLHFNNLSGVAYIQTILYEQYNMHIHNNKCSRFIPSRRVSLSRYDNTIPTVAAAAAVLPACCINNNKKSLTSTKVLKYNYVTSVRPNS